jgi:hypothetical protein
MKKICRCTIALKIFALVSMLLCVSPLWAQTTSRPAAKAPVAKSAASAPANPLSPLEAATAQLDKAIVGYAATLKTGKPADTTTEAISRLIEANIETINAMGKELGPISVSDIEGSLPAIMLRKASDALENLTFTFQAFISADPQTASGWAARIEPLQTEYKKAVTQFILMKGPATATDSSEYARQQLSRVQRECELRFSRYIMAKSAEGNDAEADRVLLTCIYSNLFDVKGALDAIQKYFPEIYDAMSQADPMHPIPQRIEYPDEWYQPF